MTVRDAVARAVILGVLAAALFSCNRKGPCETLVVEVIGDHSHTATVSPDKVKRGVEGAYLVRGSEHQHAFRLDEADMRTLMSGGSVTTRTSSSNAHVHDVVVRCER